MLKQLKAVNDELKAAKTALSESEARFAQMADTTDDIVWISDAEHKKMLYVNNAFERIFGKRKETVFKNLDSYAECVHPEDKALLTLIHRNTEIKKTSVRFRVINQTTGEIKWIHSRFSPYKDENGNVRFIAGIASDITNIVDADSEIAVNRQIIAQQGKFASLGEMIGAISHQWRQPLNTLYLYLQMLDDMNDEISPDRKTIAEYLANSLKLIDHMSETIDDFRDFFKPVKHPEPFDAPRTVLQTLRMIAPQMTAHHISYHINCTCEKRSFSCSNNFDPGNPPCKNLVNGIANEFKHAILNILQNAKEALSQNNKPNKDIYIDMSTKDGFFRISITDSAGGIDNAMIDCMFEAYATGKKDGTGMGLYMTKTIIEEKMGGKIWAENTDIGARFTIELPCFSA